MFFVTGYLFADPGFYFFFFEIFPTFKPKASAYYRCVEDHFEQLETVWLPARRTYNSERTNVIRAALAFGGFM